MGTASWAPGDCCNFPVHIENAIERAFPTISNYTLDVKVWDLAERWVDITNDAQAEFDQCEGH